MRQQWLTNVLAETPYHDDIFPVLQEDAELFALFCEWRDNPTLSQDAAFIARIVCDDVTPCLAFPNKSVRIRNRKTSRRLFYQLAWLKAERTTFKSAVSVRAESSHRLPMLLPISFLCVV